MGEYDRYVFTIYDPFMWKCRDYPEAYSAYLLVSTCVRSVGSLGSPTWYYVYPFLGSYASTCVHFAKGLLLPT